MKAYETTSTVEEQGQVRVQGVPYPPGTEVEITITPAGNGEHAAVTAAERAAQLFATLDRGRNAETVGPLRRQELYDRDVLR